MEVENDNIEPVTELGLALGYSRPSGQTRSNSDSGAGANAGSRVEMKFVATDPLSELVWSPQTGLSLKCADYSFVDKKSSLRWGAGPSNVVLSSSENFGAKRSRNAKPTIEENFIMSQDACLLMNETPSRYTRGSTPGIDIAAMPRSGAWHEDNIADLRPDLTLYAPLSGEPTGGGKDGASGNQPSTEEIVLASKDKESEANDTSMQNLTSAGKRDEESASFLVQDRKNKITRTNSISVHHLEKLESIAENDLQNLTTKIICVGPSKVEASESAHEVKTSSQRDEETVPKDKTVSHEHSSSSRSRRSQKKGKERALSVGDVNDRTSKEDDDSHESVESCNSTGLFSKGKRRWSFEQQFIVENKKVKKQIQETPCSTSNVKQYSSFMNWISNMVKGFPKINQEELPSLDLTLSNPTYAREGSDHKLITYNKNLDTGSRSVGFQSIFHSLYRTKTKGHESTLDDDHQTGLEVVKGICGISATPLAYHADNDNECNQFLLPYEKFSESTSADETGTTTQPKISPASFGSIRVNSKENSAMNPNSCNVVAAQGEGGTDSNSSMGKCKMGSAANIKSEPTSKVNKTPKLVHGNDPLRSLWITRFVPNPSFPSSNLENQNQCRGGALECSNNSHQLLPCSLNLNTSPNDLNIVEARPHSTKDLTVSVGKAVQDFSAEADTSSGFERLKGNRDQKFICQLKPTIPSPRYSEAMASVFARRLDALRHIMPSDIPDGTASATITCFFCGRKGHHLRNCLEITDGELKDLLRNIDSYNGAEELPCFCIRCFQLSHWAVSCPNISSREQSQLEGNNFCPNEMQLDKRYDESKSLLYGNNCMFQAAGAQTVYGRDHHQKEADPKFNSKLYEVVTAERTISKVYLLKACNASGSGEKKFVDRAISEVPTAIFNFLKRLRLSRTDILKLMNSRTSLAHLNGFFLRLRLGKWEQGLGGSGYYVACIAGAQREINLPQSSKNSISVDVGGIKCLVETQYISNHDFLETELMAWWSATMKSRGEIPSEEELRTKIKERKMLGL